MGTNYYLIKDVCPSCGRGERPKHIGKSSGGWCFSLHVYPDEGINDLSDWEKLIRDPKNAIEKDDGERVSFDFMMKVIAGRSHSRPLGVGKPDHYDSWEQYYERNDAEPGPNNLLRHRVDGKYCIGHGSGTWDLIVGDFS